MGSRTGPRHKLSRREGVPLFGPPSPSLERRLAVPPGQHGLRRARPSEYRDQLREKQKVKRVFGLREKQFRNLFREAERRKGPTGTELLRLLELRLDNVVYRLSFARTRPMARQLVGHGHVRVDGRRVDIPSYRLSPGEVVSLTDAAAAIPGVAEALTHAPPPPSWLHREGASGRVLDLPAPDDLLPGVDTEKVIAFYTR